MAALTPATPSWYARLEGSPNDIAALKRHFADSGFSFDEIDGKFALAAPQFEAYASGDTGAVIDAATKLLNAVNVALRLSDGCNGFEVLSIVERRNRALYRTLCVILGISGFLRQNCGSTASPAAARRNGSFRLWDVTKALRTSLMVFLRLPKHGQNLGAPTRRSRASRVASQTKNKGAPIIKI
jgi:hypothetical protein